MATQLANIDVFNLTVLRLFAQLYDAFPVPKNIDSQDIGASASDAVESESITDAMKLILYAEHAVTWLAEEGFIRYSPDGPRGTTFTGVRLTLKGLTVLGYLPTALQAPEKQRTLISRIKAVLAGGAEKAGTEAVKAILTDLFRLAMTTAVGQQSPPGISA